MQSDKKNTPHGGEWEMVELLIRLDGMPREVVAHAEPLAHLVSEYLGNADGPLAFAQRSTALLAVAVAYCANAGAHPREILGVVQRCARGYPSDAAPKPVGQA